MRDLLIVVPSRGRPRSVARLCRAVRDTAVMKTDLLFGFDQDDPEREASAVAVRATLPDWGTAAYATAPRMGLSQYTNVLAIPKLDEYRAIASFGDDHVPQTYGWDQRCLDAIQGRPGFVCPNDISRPGHPEAVVISSGIIRALGWMCLPTLDHFYVDDVWKDLGEATNSFHYLPNVIVEHARGPADQTYIDNDTHAPHDKDAYDFYRGSDQFHLHDIAAVRRAIQEAERGTS